MDADADGGGDADADNSDGVSDYMVGDYTEGDDDDDEKKRAKRHPRGKKAIEGGFASGGTATGDRSRLDFDESWSSQHISQLPAVCLKVSPAKHFQRGALSHRRRRVSCGTRSRCNLDHKSGNRSAKARP